MPTSQHACLTSFLSLTLLLGAHLILISFMMSESSVTLQTSTAPTAGIATLQALISASVGNFSAAVDERIQAAIQQQMQRQDPPATDTVLDAIVLRYGWLPTNLPTKCPCGLGFTVQHALSCPTGGFPTSCHNKVRDFTANLMADVYHDVCTEPHLQPITLQEPLPSLRMEQGWMLLLAGSGVAAMTGLSSTSESSTLTQPQTATSLPPATENLKTSRNRPTNSVSRKLNMVPSHP